MQDVLSFISLNAPAILVFFVAVFAVLFLRVFGKKIQADRWAAALPFIFETIADLVERADQIHDQILVDYADEAAATGDDPRLLWVIDQVELFVQKTFRVTVDLNWLIEQIEIAVARHQEDRAVEEEVENDAQLQAFVRDFLGTKKEREEGFRGIVD